MASKNLPVNIDTTYSDDPADASRQVHQTHHDDTHEVVNLFDYDALVAATAGYYLFVDPATGLIAAVAPPTTVPVNLVSTASYTAVVGDNGKVIERSFATACTLTIPAGVFSAGMQFGVTQVGAGQLTFVQGVGMTIRSEGGFLASRGQWADQLVRFRSATECVLAGGLA